MARANQNGTWRRVLRSDATRPALKKRLLIPIAAVLILTWLGAAVFTKKAAFRESRAFLAGEADAVAQTLLALPPSSGVPVQLSGDEARTLMLWRQGALVFSQNAMEIGAPQGASSWVELIGTDNWVFSTSCVDATCALVAIRDTERKLAIRRLVAVIYIPLLAILGLGLLAAAIVINRAIRPITEVSGRVVQMNLDKLEPLSVTGLDQELLPLVTAINHLMDRMRKQLDQERAFLSIYAHEIRTPVAGLAAQMQILKAEVSCDGPIVQNVLDCADRTTRVANQFLALARSKNMVGMPHNNVPLNFVEQVRQSLIETMASTPDINIVMTGTCEAEMMIDPFALDTIVRNLVGNAILYAAPKDEPLKILVDCSANPEVVALRVEDNGQGLTTEQMALALQEFGRIPSKNKPSGAGLGLSIVSQISNTFGGRLDLGTSSQLNGLACSVIFPANAFVKLRHAG